MTFHRRAAWRRVALMAVALAALTWNIRIYYPFIADDALISLRYAERLLTGHGLTWTDGQPVEGYSNLLWVLLVALAGAVGMDLVLAARGLGVASITIVLAALIWRGTRAAVADGGWISTAVGALFVSFSASIAVWAIGGLEQPLVGALLALAIVLMFSALEREPGGGGARSIVLLSVVLGLLCLTRPDGPLFTVAAVVTWALAGPGTWARRATVAIQIALIPLACYLAQTGFRYVYYGELVPNTALVKLTPTAVRRADGLAYLKNGLTALGPLSYLAMAGLLVLAAVRSTRARGLFLLVLASLWSVYLAVIGGDIFPAYRHFIPLIVIFAFALVEVLQLGMDRLAGRAWATPAVGIASALLFLPYVPGQVEDRQSRRGVTERWEWQCKDLAEVIGTAFRREQPLLAVTAAGCLPYWAKLPALDMLGLNDYYLPRHPPPDHGTGFLGHELGDGAYVMERRPDIIVFNVGSEPAYRGGLQLAGMPEFRDGYVPVAVKVQGIFPAPLVYFDRHSARVGVRTDAGAVAIPGYLFRSAASRAYLASSGQLVTAVASGEPLTAELTGQAASAVGSAEGWTVEVESSRADQIQAAIERRGDHVAVILETTAEMPVEVSRVMLRGSGGN